MSIEDNIRVTTHAEFSTWLRDPRATSPCVYHVGNLGADRAGKSTKSTAINEIGNIALNASDSGFVTLTQRNSDVRGIWGSVWNYVATKTSTPVPKRRPLSYARIDRITR